MADFQTLQKQADVQATKEETDARTVKADATVALQGSGGNVEVAVNRLLAQPMPMPADGAARSDAAEVVIDD